MLTVTRIYQRQAVALTGRKVDRHKRERPSAEERAPDRQAMAKVQVVIYRGSRRIPSLRCCTLTCLTQRAATRRRRQPSSSHCPISPRSCDEKLRKKMQLAEPKYPRMVTRLYMLHSIVCVPTLRYDLTAVAVPCVLLQGNDSMHSAHLPSDEDHCFREKAERGLILSHLLQRFVDSSLWGDGDGGDGSGVIG